MVIKRIIHKIYLIFYSRLITNKYWLWYWLTPKRNRECRKKICDFYKKAELHDKVLSDDLFHGVILLYEGGFYQGGLADRLRGILSIYKSCKELEIPFRLKFIHPFNLSWYLMPNSYDWTVNETEISHDMNLSKVTVLDVVSDSFYARNKQEQFVLASLKRNMCKQHHIYTNSCYSYDYNYAELFWELFRLSPRLASSIERQKKEIGGPYISISARFLDSLGDFNESFGFNHPLSSQERDSLIKSNLYQIEKLHAAYPAHRILVNSDSITFLSEAARLSYVYVNPGIITHIDNTASASYETFEKTFLDYFMIANAEHIYLLKTKWMHRSGYPYAASLIYAKPFDVIEF